jgi:hypothetical protein
MIKREPVSDLIVNSLVQGDRYFTSTNHFRGSGTREAVVFKAVDSSSLVGGQCPGTLEISLDQLLHDLFCTQKIVRRNPGRPDAWTGEGRHEPMQIRSCALNTAILR